LNCRWKDRTDRPTRGIHFPFQQTTRKFADFSPCFFYTQSAVKVKVIRRQVFSKSVLGAAVAVLCGLLLWKMPLGEPWVNASYDY
jgi:hypothetical protein